MSGRDKRKCEFHFKQFSIKHEHSAMKVGTDGVLIGAWADVSSSKHVFDAGSGSGLISLMVAQRCNALITGVEIDDAAYNESILNAKLSPWCERISFIHGDITKIDLISGFDEIDHIISNPPFFHNGITAPDDKRAIARHCNSLDFNLLLKLASEVLPNSGKLSFIAPASDKREILLCASSYNLYLSRCCDVYSKTTDNQPVRILCEFSKVMQPTENTTMFIRDSKLQYSAEYINLTKEYYLNF